jgi:tRNA(Ile)-lysidine synthase
MAARELRYNWFNELLKKHGLSRIVTGHHLNDSIETLLLNLCRGTGINGLKGIAALNGNIARPLLFATRERIESYARLHNLTYRIDSTNQSDNYLRNIIRQSVIPGLKKVNPDFEERMRDNFDQINQAAEIYNAQISFYKMQFLTDDNKRKVIDLEGIVNNPFAKTILFELVQPFGFNNSQVNNILTFEKQNSGQLFFSQTHKMLVNRKKLIIDKQKAEDLEIIRP